MDVLDYILSDLSIRSILKVGVVIARSIHDYHVIEFLALNVLGYRRWTLFTLKNAVSDFSVISLL